MHDYLFECGSEAALNKFKQLVSDEELWSKHNPNSTSLTVCSIYESTAEWLYSELEKIKAAV